MPERNLYDLITQMGYEHTPDCHSSCTGHFGRILAESKAGITSKGVNTWTWGENVCV